MRILIVGRGRLGRAVCTALRARGIEASTTRGRSPAPSSVRKAELVLLAVPDGAIAPVASVLAPSLAPRTVVLHTAGNRTATELTVLADAGFPVGVLHPFVSLVGRADAHTFVGTTCFVSGAPRARTAARRLVRMLGARDVVGDVHGPVYHAAAAVTANGAAALVYAAQTGLCALGLTKRQADAALAGLLGSVARNVAVVGLPKALTGPVVRGDADAVRRHRRAVRAVPALAEAYDALERPLLACASAAGLSPAAVRSVEAAYRADVGAGADVSVTPQRRARRVPRR